MYTAVRGEGSEVFLSAPIPWLFVSQINQGGKFCLPQREAYSYRGTFYFLCRGKLFSLVAVAFIQISERKQQCTWRARTGILHLTISLWKTQERIKIRCVHSIPCHLKDVDFVFCTSLYFLWAEGFMSKCKACVLSWGNRQVCTCKKERRMSWLQTHTTKLRYSRLFCGR